MYKSHLMCPELNHLPINCNKKGQPNDCPNKHACTLVVYGFCSTNITKFMKTNYLTGPIIIGPSFLLLN